MARRLRMLPGSNRVSGDLRSSGNGMQAPGRDAAPEHCAGIARRGGRGLGDGASLGTGGRYLRAPICWRPALAHAPGAVAIGEVEREVAALEKAGTLHAVDLPGAETSLATDRTVGEERETVALMRGRSGSRPGADARLAGPGAPQQGAADGRGRRTR